MKQYIDKSAIVTKIERLQDSTMDEDRNFYSLSAQAEYNVLCMLENYINTLEVKDVDLERAIDKWIDDAAITHEDCSITDVISTAKHFFELGLKAQKGE